MTGRAPNGMMSMFSLHASVIDTKANSILQKRITLDSSGKSTRTSRSIYSWRIQCYPFLVNDTTLDMHTKPAKGSVPQTFVFASFTESERSTWISCLLRRGCSTGSAISADVPAHNERKSVFVLSSPPPSPNSSPVMVATHASSLSAAWLDWEAKLLESLPAETNSSDILIDSSAFIAFLRGVANHTKQGHTHTPQKSVGISSVIKQTRVVPKTQTSRIMPIFQFTNTVIDALREAACLGTPVLYTVSESSIRYRILDPAPHVSRFRGGVREWYMAWKVASSAHRDVTSRDCKSFEEERLGHAWNHMLRDPENVVILIYPTIRTPELDGSLAIDGDPYSDGAQSAVDFQFGTSIFQWNPPCAVSTKLSRKVTSHIQWLIKMAGIIWTHRLNMQTVTQASWQDGSVCPVTLYDVYRGCFDKKRVKLADELRSSILPSALESLNDGSAAAEEVTSSSDIVDKQSVFNPDFVTDDGAHLDSTAIMKRIDDMLNYGHGFAFYVNAAQQIVVTALGQGLRTDSPINAPRLDTMYSRLRLSLSRNNKIVGIPPEVVAASIQALMGEECWRWKSFCDYASAWFSNHSHSIPTLIILYRMAREPSDLISGTLRYGNLVLHSSELASSMSGMIGWLSTRPFMSSSHYREVEIKSLTTLSDLACESEFVRLYRSVFGSAPTLSQYSAGHESEEDDKTGMSVWLRQRLQMKQLSGAQRSRISHMSAGMLAAFERHVKSGSVDVSNVAPVVHHPSERKEGEPPVVASDTDECDEDDDDNAENDTDTVPEYDEDMDHGAAFDPAPNIYPFKSKMEIKEFMEWLVLISKISQPATAERVVKLASVLVGITPADAVLFPELVNSPVSEKRLTPWATARYADIIHCDGALPVAQTIISKQTAGKGT